MATASGPDESKNSNGTAAVIIDASDTNADLLYATRFVAGDPFSYVEVGGRSHLILSDLEYGRGKKDATVDEVVSYSELEKELARDGVDPVQIEHVVAHFLRKKSAGRVRVPATFPIRFADHLRDAGFELEVTSLPFFKDRLIKKPEEISSLRAAQTATEDVMLDAIHEISRAEIVGNDLMLDGELLTVERLKTHIRHRLLELEFMAGGIIAAPGDQGCDPHNLGSGPIRAHESVILDIFPRHMHSHYWGDMTRTVCRGEPSPELQSIYDAVKRAQDAAIASVRPGVRGSDVHALVVQSFKDDGYETRCEDGTWQGFFHGTGHGVGLDIHESPRVGKNGSKLDEGMVVTIEPGLYYPGIGAVRIEDIVVVTADGCSNLNKAPKILAI